MSRAWLVEKDARACGNYSCESYRAKVKGSKFSLDETTGLARYGCIVCGKENETQLRSWKERRACKLCQYVRNVTVYKYSGGGEEHANEYCDAREALKSAWKHTYTAQQLKMKATNIYSARGVDVPTLEQYRKILNSSP